MPERGVVDGACAHLPLRVSLNEAGRKARFFVPLCWAGFVLGRRGLNAQCIKMCARSMVRREAQLTRSFSSCPFVMSYFLPLGKLAPIYQARGRHWPE